MLFDRNDANMQRTVDISGTVGTTLIQKLALNFSSTLGIMFLIQAGLINIGVTYG